MATVRDQSGLRAEANQARDEAREHGQKGSEAAKETAQEYKGAVQQEGLSMLKGAEDRYDSAKEYTKQKSGQAADTAVAAKDEAVDTAAAAKDEAVDTTTRAKNSVAVSFQILQSLRVSIYKVTIVLCDAWQLLGSPVWWPSLSH